MYWYEVSPDPQESPVKVWKILEQSLLIWFPVFAVNQNTVLSYIDIRYIIHNTCIDNIFSSVHYIENSAVLKNVVCKVTSHTCWLTGYCEVVQGKHRTSSLRNSSSPSSGLVDGDEGEPVPNVHLYNGHPVPGA